MAYVLYAGFARRSDRRAGIAAAVVAAETLIFAGNRFSCPLTGVAGRLGAGRGSVTDIYLPRWFARNVVATGTRLGVSMRVLERLGSFVQTYATKSA